MRERIGEDYVNLRNGRHVRHLTVDHDRLVNDKYGGKKKLEIVKKMDGLRRT